MTENQTLQSKDRSEKKTFSGEPLTDYDSKTVMIAAERNDDIQIEEVVTRLDDTVQIPETVSVIKREETYYGPELMVHCSFNGNDRNYLLNAPGPSSQLRLWSGQRSGDGRRSGWTEVAEVKAVLTAEQPPYEVCSQCGEQIRTIEHEREAAIGQCSRVQTN